MRPIQFKRFRIIVPCYICRWSSTEHLLIGGEIEKERKSISVLVSLYQSLQLIVEFTISKFARFCSQKSLAYRTLSKVKRRQKNSCLHDDGMCVRRVSLQIEHINYAVRCLSKARICAVQLNIFSWYFHRFYFGSSKFLSLFLAPELFLCVVGSKIWGDDTNSLKSPLRLSVEYGQRIVWIRNHTKPNKVLCRTEN